MNTTLLLNKASKAVDRAKTQAAVDAKAAQLAHELARAAKVNLKHARKLSKMARKSARKAEDRAGESSVTLETAQAKLEILRERIRNEQRKNNTSPKPKPPWSDDALPRNQPKSKPVVRSTHGARQSAQKTVNGKPAPAVAPEPKRVPPTHQELGDMNPLPAPDIAAPSVSGKEPTNDRAAGDFDKPSG
jgi:hypothetical protein